MLQKNQVGSTDFFSFVRRYFLRLETERAMMRVIYLLVNYLFMMMMMMMMMNYYT